MFRPLAPSHRRPPRRGTVVLITCFFLITIMMVLGLALMMYAAREKAAALAYQDAAGGGGTPTRVAPPPEGTVNQFLSSLIYDVPDDDTGSTGSNLLNALRGHSIARSMYGSQYDFSTTPWAGQTVPWAGVGTFSEDATNYYYTGTSVYGALSGIDRSQIVNHTVLQMNGQFLLVDPEWTGNRQFTAGNLGPFASTRGGKHYVGKHAGYTYPDLKNFFLAQRDPATGEVLVPSFHRDWLFGGLDPSNANWTTNESGRVKTLRPRPAEHPNFPRVPPNADGSYSGDVQNLPGGYVYNSTTKRFAGRNDSLWMHIGLPRVTLSDGRVVQPMVAPLILPLDGNFDLSVHGNTLASGGAHHSYGGYGRWEVNPAWGLAGTPRHVANTSDPDPAVNGTMNEADRQALLGQRSTNGRVAAFDPYNSNSPTPPYGQLLPVYAGVAWTGDGAQVEFTLPVEQKGAPTPSPNFRPLLGLPSSGDAAYTVSGATTKFANFRNQNYTVTGHPAAYNANEFAAATETSEASTSKSPVLPYSDLKRLSLRYAFTPSWYAQAFATRRAGATFSTQPLNPTSRSYQYFYAPGPDPTKSYPDPLAGNLPYRTDPAHTNRLLFSTRYNALDRAALTPSFASINSSNALQIPTGSTKPGQLPTATTPYPSPSSAPPSGVTDFMTVSAGSPNRWVSAQAILGSVNLNRPLADYRVDRTQPLYPDSTSAPNAGGNTNVTAGPTGSAATADTDRQALAKDIFARLIIATGAAADVKFTTAGAETTPRLHIRLPDPSATPQFTLTAVDGTTVGPFNQQQYDALRYLAQLAANLVDYIDNDDVSTMFVWNPTDPLNPATSLTTDLSAAQIGNRAVFGVEKPRLVLNEVYSEITNDPADKEQETPPAPLTDKKAHVRFWAELLNPTATPHDPPTGAQGIFGDGSVPLAAYQIQIGRTSRTFVDGTTLTTAQAPAVPLVPNSPTDAIPQSRLANTLGAFDTSTTANGPDATCTLSALTLPQQSVKPNNGQYAGTPPTAAAPGVVLLRTKITPGANSPKADEFSPNTGTGVWQNSIECPAADAANALGYKIKMPAKTELANAEFKRHVVTLRRLANPYLIAQTDPALPNYNPYVTVDMMDYVPAFDAVLRADGDSMKRMKRPASDTSADKYDPVDDATQSNNRFSVGKVQPLAGYSFATVTPGVGKYNAYTFGGGSLPASPNSMVLNQSLATPNATEPVNTFGRHNGANTTQPGSATVPTPTGAAIALNTTVDDHIMLPFDWQVHMDRPLETPGDVMFARDCKPFQLTQEFVANTATGLKYDTSYGRWAFHASGLARALELLAVKSPDVFTGHGGRTAGKVNMNAVTDRRIAQGVWDPQSTNRFDMPFVKGDSTTGTGVWEGWMNSRSPLQNRIGSDGNTDVTKMFRVAVAGASPSAADQPRAAAATLDRPFLPFGAPVASKSGFAYANPKNVDTTTVPLGNDDGDTLLRRPAPPNNNNPPYLFLDPNASGYTDPNTRPGAAARHAYTQSEPFRKVVSNVNTVSHTFVVYVTIGYFDVQTVSAGFPFPANVNGGQLPQFGEEIYDQVPGDMRQKYMAVVDMSAMALKPDATNIGPDPHATEQPFFTALTATARAGASATLSLAASSVSTDGKTLYVTADGYQVAGQPAGMPIGMNTQLVIGHGAEAQLVTVSAVNGYTSTTGVGQVTVTGLQRDAWGGAVVSNVRPGYAGPRSGFDLFSPTASPMYKPVVPYVERLK